MSIILALGLPLILACFFAGIGTVPSKTEHKEKWEEEVSLLKDDHDPKN